jgi:quercetin dioxygenase-like cupin family protein
MRQRYERLSTTFKGSVLNAVKVRMMEGYCSEWIAHGGDEFVFVLSGQVRYTIRKKDYPLSAGDSLHFDAQQRHRVMNTGTRPAELIVVGTLPLFDDDQSKIVVLANANAPKKRGSKKVAEATPVKKARKTR